MAKKKAKQPTVYLTVTLDESGSMRGRERSVVDGINEFIAALKQADGDPVVVSIYAFDSDRPNQPNVRTWVYAVPLEEVPEISQEQYQPWGGTPLNDAIARAVSQTAEQMGKG